MIGTASKGDGRIINLYCLSVMKVIMKVRIVSLSWGEYYVKI